MIIELEKIAPYKLVGVSVALQSAFAPLGVCNKTMAPGVAVMPSDRHVAPALVWPILPQALGFPPFTPAGHALMFLINFRKTGCPQVLEWALVCRLTSRSLLNPASLKSSFHIKWATLAHTCLPPRTTVALWAIHGLQIPHQCGFMPHRYYQLLSLVAPMP